jgi:hypothetical protein
MHQARDHPRSPARDAARGAGFAEVEQGYEGFFAPVFPRLWNVLRKPLAPWPLDLSDHGSWLARIVPPRRRALWRLLLRAPARA